MKKNFKIPFFKTNYDRKELNAFQKLLNQETLAWEKKRKN